MFELFAILTSCSCSKLCLEVCDLLFHVLNLSKSVEVIHLVPEHFIFSRNDSCEEIPPFSCFDLEKWMQWLKEYVGSAAQALDSLELEKRDIDVEALKAQIEEELTDKLKPELRESIAAELRDTLTRELEASIEDKLREFLDGTFAARTHDSLKEELQGELNAALYESLYKALYDALYTPPKNEDEGFTPLI